jgi:hypothetical protein
LEDGAGLFGPYPSAGDFELAAALRANRIGELSLGEHLIDLAPEVVIDSRFPAPGTQREEALEAFSRAKVKKELGHLQMAFQLAGIDRLAEVDIHPIARLLKESFLADPRRQQYEIAIVVETGLAYSPAQFDAVYFRHRPVGDDQIEIFLEIAPPGLAAVFAGGHIISPASQHIFQIPAREGVVFCYEYFHNCILLVA